MQLLLTATSPFARAVRIALMIKGLDSECRIVWVDPSSDTPELLQANPHSRVPVLILDNGLALTETLLIMQYLDRRTPDPTLLPNSTYLEELSLAGLAIGLMEASFWVVFNRRFNPEKTARNNPLELRRLASITRTLDQLRDLKPHPLKNTPGLGQLLLKVALDYLEFRLPDLKAIERTALQDWNKPFQKLEPFTLTEFY